MIKPYNSSYCATQTCCNRDFFAKKMNSLNLKVTDPNAILSLIEELCDLPYIEIQLKLNTYVCIVL